MRITSITRCSVVGMVALSVACLGTGCRGTNWSVPGSSWMSWNKKKPSTSSIAGTRSVPQPPSIATPPYQAPGSPTAPVSYGQMAAGPRGDALAPGGGSGAAQPQDYYTGPYNTGSAGTQQGFYSPTRSQPPAAAMTADRRAALPYGATGPGYSPTNGAGTYDPAASALPNSAGAPGYNAASPYGAAQTPAYGAPATPAPGGSPYAPPAGSYPSTAPTSSYQPPAATGYPAPYSGVAAGGAGSYQATPTTGQNPGDSSTAAPASYSALEPWRPGSTSRNSQMLDGNESAGPTGYAEAPAPASYEPTGGYNPNSAPYPAPGTSIYGPPTQTANPNGAPNYPSTYNR